MAAKVTVLNWDRNMAECCVLVVNITKIEQNLYFVVKSHLLLYARAHIYPDSVVRPHRPRAGDVLRLIASHPGARRHYAEYSPSSSSSSSSSPSGRCSSPPSLSSSSSSALDSADNEGLIECLRLLIYYAIYAFRFII